MSSPPQLTRRLKLFLFLGLLLLVIVTPVILGFLGLPENIHLVRGIEQTFEFRLPFDLYFKCTKGKLSINGQADTADFFKVDNSHPLALKADEIGRSDLEARLFGIIPLKNIVVNVLPQVKVIPSGVAIGVFLQPEGVLVLEESFVETPEGKRVTPARDAGIQAGDTILEINGVKIANESEAATLINNLGKDGQALKITVRDKNGNLTIKEVRPARSKTGHYMIGIYIDDGIAGVGTLTFYHQETKNYGALGHMITREEERNSYSGIKGKIVRAEISGINAGKQGLPGEKLGVFYQKRDVLGDIRKNTEYGIYGQVSELPQNPYFPEPIPVATCFQIKEGPAKIYTVLEGGKIDEFEIRIEKVNHQIKPAQKGLVVRITDSRLLNLTGGIVQGMSGSPIVQDGKFVGAITHVFINDPTRGYGVLGEWMVKEAGLFEEEPGGRSLPKAG
ncbi:MAG: SpoIVB peptidase [Halanaerobium sp.]|nr:SpoIVB peptidase [Halanaerobium sp.]